MSGYLASLCPTSFARLREISQEHYRRLAIGEGSAAELKAKVWAQLRTFVATWADETAPGGGSESALKRYLDQRFGVVMGLSWAAGYYGLHYGHRVIEIPERLFQRPATC